MDYDKAMLRFSHDWHERDQRHKVYLHRQDGARQTIAEFPSVQSAMAMVAGCHHVYLEAYLHGRTDGARTALELLAPALLTLLPK